MRKLVVAVTMARNEADILPCFLTHTAQLVDHHVIIDHLSTDGTWEICERAKDRGLPLSLFSFPYQGYYQSQISKAASQWAFDHGAEWVVFLDADEFVDFPDRVSLRSSLDQGQASGAAFFQWRNCIPAEYGSFERFNLGHGYWQPDSPSKYRKVAIHAGVAEKPDYFVHMGNHAAALAPNSPFLDGPVIGSLLHFPVRSRERLEMKLRTACAAMKQKTSRGASECFHWFELLNAIERQNGILRQSQLNWLIANYGEPLDRLGDLVPSQESGWLRRSFPSALMEQLGGSRNQEDAQRLERSLNWEDLHDATAFFLDDPNANGAGRQRGQLNRLKVRSLPRRPPVQTLA